MNAFRGVRLRITAFATLTVLVVMLTAGLVLVTVQQHVMTDNLDETLQTHSKNIERAFLAGTLPLVLEQQGSNDAIAQVVYQDTTVLASTENMVGQRPLDAPKGDVQRRDTHLTIDESGYRLLSRRVGDVVIHTGTPNDDVEEAADALRLGLAFGIPGITLLLGVLVWWLVGRMLRQVQTSVERQERFVADASHELRSPLTRVRTELEVDLQHPATANPTATHRSVLEEVDHLQRLVDDLLLLARADVNTTPLDQVVELVPLIDQEVERLPQSNVTVTSSLSEASVMGDATQLARVVRNLLDNAVRHARSTVAIAMVVMGDVVRLTIDDDGSGVPEHERGRVFERFARLDEARTAGAGGTGLGLAIAHDIVERHGGTIGIESSPLGGARLVVHLHRRSIT